MPLRLGITMKEYERTAPILRGQIPIDGIEPTFVPFKMENFQHMLADLEYDISEMSFSSYLIARERSVPVVAIPVFPNRRFRHSYIFVDTKGRINEPIDLIGKRVGIPSYQLTALVWIRGILTHEYDVRPDQIKWYYDRDWEPLPIALPNNVFLRNTGGIKNEKLFLEEKLDALLDPNTPSIFEEGNPAIKRLFDNYRAVELDYYRRTGIFPIMHTIVVKESLLKEHPWIATSLWKAFVEAKQLSYSNMKDPRVSNLAWPHVYWEEEKAIFGNDLWPYNLKDNRKALETLISYVCEQGLISKEPMLEDLFASSTLDFKEK